MRRDDDSRHRMFPVGLYATLLIGLFGVTFPVMFAPVEAAGRTLVTLPLRAYSILFDATPVYAAADPLVDPSTTPVDLTQPARREAKGPAGHTPRACRVLDRRVGPLGFVDELILDLTLAELPSNASVVTSGDSLLGFVESRRPDAPLTQHVRVRLLHYRARRRAASEPLRVRSLEVPSRVAAQVDCREVDAQGVLRFLIEPGRAVDRWPLRCTTLDDSYLGARLRTSGDPVTTTRSDDSRVPAGLRIGRLMIWGYPEHDIPVGLFVEPAVDPRAISSVLVWMPSDGSALSSVPVKHELLPVRFTRFPAPRPSFERWMVTSAADRVLPDGAALVDAGRLLGRLREPWSGQSLVTPFAASTRAWSLILRNAGGEVHELVGRVRGRDAAGRLRLEVLAPETGVRFAGELFTGANGPHCPAGIRIGGVEPGSWSGRSARRAMSAVDRRRSESHGELWITLPSTPVTAPHVFVHGSGGVR